MAYEYEHRPPTATDQGVGSVADVYVARDLSQRVEPSHEFLTALEKLSSSTQAVVRRLIDQGFENVIRK